MSLLRKSAGSIGAIAIKQSDKNRTTPSNETSPATSPVERESMLISSPTKRPKMTLFTKSPDKDKNSLSSKTNENSLPPVVQQAVEKGDLASLQKLTKPTLGGKRLYFDHVATKGRTILHLACEVGHKEIVNWIIESADKLEEVLEQEDSSSNTPLCRSILSGHFEIAQKLVQSGASITRPEIGSIPYSRPFSLFIQACSDFEHFLDSSSVQQLFNTFIQRNIPINAVDQNKDTYLHQATLLQHPLLVDLLLLHGGNVNAQNQFGETPLHFILKKFNRNLFHSPDSEILSILKKLISAGADPYTLKTEQGNCLDLIRLTQKGREHQHYLLWLVRGLQGLPNPILIKILSYLSPQPKLLTNLLNVSVVSKKLRSISKEDELWLPIWNSHQFHNLRKSRTKSGFLYSDLISEYYNEDLIYYLSPPAANSPSTFDPPSSSPSSALKYKVMFVGDSGTGKSKFMCQFLHSPYSPFPPKDVDIGTKHISITTPKHQIQIKLSEHSPRGRRAFSGKTSPYRGIDLFLIFCSLENRQSFERAKQWLTEVKRYNVDADKEVREEEEGVFMIVGTRNGGKREVGRREVEEMVEKLGKTFVETNEGGGNVAFAMMVGIEEVVRKREKKGKKKGKEGWYIW
eukprot:TRINITY_DN26791_c0_g1_i1.p1 TRINITY_DN26791_c0_g1~~TRINITY_DN26791_c0_g1_i1.p1  ORF type:complete len:630 (-),score=133.60 TRINITY_DN26791_c0_g1_i1:24-1913(-)